jgi:lipoyl(octanoyl) transferase
MIETRILGRISFQEAYTLQRRLWAERVAGKIHDQLLLLEHPPVITMGSGFRRSHLLASADLLAESGIELVATDRGGDVTYHGPGQLIGYPILDLQPDRMDVLRYLRDLEEVLLRILGEFGIRGYRREGFTGVWVNHQKIASIGVKISRWVTYHGFALNVNTNLAAFDLIVPCGIADVRMTSLQKELGQAPPMREVTAIASEKMNEVFSGEIPATRPTTQRRTYQQKTRDQTARITADLS